jgi:hypothetical protein
MQHYPHSYTSDPVRALHLISDAVWRELRANRTFNQPGDPETSHGKITRRVMRYEIGRQVMSYAESGQMTNGEISQAIVKRMSFTYRLEPARVRNLGEPQHETNARTPTVVRTEIKFHYL